MNIVKTVNGEETVLAVEGRIDATNSRELQDAIKVNRPTDQKSVKNQGDSAKMRFLK